jgi:hypothetical protein
MFNPIRTKLVNPFLMWAYHFSPSCSIQKGSNLARQPLLASIATSHLLPSSASSHRSIEFSGNQKKKSSLFPFLFPKLKLTP